MGYLDPKNIFMFSLVIPIVFCGFLIMRNHAEVDYCSVDFLYGFIS